jgi:cellulose synthase/poly-beta-1,6-N-acetylglucosamine synthase-like glycosyltransferase
MALRRPALASLPARRSITTGLAANGRSKGLDSESSLECTTVTRWQLPGIDHDAHSPGPANVTVVMPALNEECTVGRTCALCSMTRRCTLPIARIIVVDNGSTDAPAAVARAAGAQVVSEPRCGYGSACLAGVLQAEAGDVVLLMDADGSDDVRAQRW